MADISVAIRDTEALFRAHTSAEDWSNNIVNGSRSLKTPEQWTHFYAYLASPTTYDSNRTYKAVSQKEYDDYVRPPLHKGLRETIFKNGTETIIHVVREKEEDEKECDEKSDDEKCNSL